MTKSVLAALTLFLLGLVALAVGREKAARDWERNATSIEVEEVR